MKRAWQWWDDSVFSVRNISLVYVFVVLFAAFSLWIPDTFLSGETWRSLAAEQAVTMILAIAIVVALASSMFDLSVAAVLGAASILVSHLMVSSGWDPIPATLVTLLGAVGVGAFSATAVVFFRINSFIATLAVSSVLAAFIAAVSDNQQIINLPESFNDWATFKVLGIQGAFWIGLALAAVVWFVLEHRPVGRHMYATGGNIEAARLAGVRTNRVIFGTLIATALIAAIAGIVVTSRLGSGSPTIGPPYLLPAFAAAFLGSTQVRPGRFNVLGTVISVYVLAVSVKGLQLGGAPFWLPELFNGAALLVAVAISVRRQRVKVSVGQDAAAPATAPVPVTLRQAAREKVEELRDRTGETVSVIGLPESGDGKIVEAAESRAQLRAGASLGELIPVADLDRLRAAADSDTWPLDVIQRDGVLDVRALIRDPDGAAGIVSVRAPLSRSTDERRREMEMGALSTAGEITDRLSTGRLEIKPTVAGGARQ